MFFVWVAPPVTVVDDVEFYECHAVDCHTHGFNMNQDYNDGVCRATTNIRFLNCRAVRCGYGVAGDPGITAPVTSTNQSRSEWITGFDLHEWQDLINCEVVNCVAEDNWESGFHLEPGARYDEDTGRDIGPRTVSRNVVFRNCVSSNNGQRNTYKDHFFMSGYYLSRDTHLYDCQSLQQPELRVLRPRRRRELLYGLHGRRQHVRLEGLQGERGHLDRGLQLCE